MMDSTTVRVNKQTHRAIQSLATQHQLSQGEVVAQAVEEFRRQYLLKQTAKAYGTLRADGQAWQEEQEEREAWDATLVDGIDKQ